MTKSRGKKASSKKLRTRAGSGSGCSRGVSEEIVGIHRPNNKKSSVGVKKVPQRQDHHGHDLTIKVKVTIYQGM